MALFSFSEISQKAKAAFLRFPVTLTWVLWGSFFWMCLLEFDTKNEVFKQYGNTLFVLILGVSWLIGTKFFIEQLKPSKFNHLINIIPVSGLIYFLSIFRKF